MITPEMVIEVRRLFFVEHWKIGTIASHLHLHHDTVRLALETDRFNRTKVLRPSALDPFLAFIRETLERYPRLCSTRLLAMLRHRGYPGGVRQLRRVVRRLRPAVKEAFTPLSVFAGEQAQVDWAHFGSVRVRGAERKLSCFVMTLSYSRALALEFFFDQTLESFLRGHIRAFTQLGGVARELLYDNLKSAVLERLGDAVRFHPRLLELAAHYHFAPRPCAPARGNEKGRVERAIRYIRDSFFAARPFTTLEELNRQARLWRDETAHARRWPGDDQKTVAEAFEHEQPHLVPLPVHPFDCDRMLTIRAGKTIYVRFDLNDYSIPPQAVGRTLTLLASDRDVRVVDGADVIARHHRSWGRHERITDPAHQQTLLAMKRKAQGSAPNARLLAAAPEVEALLEAAFRRAEPAGRQIRQLLGLLDDYGAEEFRAAVREALERDTPRASSVAFLLMQRRRRKNSRVPLPVDLARRPELAELHVQPHEAETYDDLTRRRDDDSR